MVRKCIKSCDRFASHPQEVEHMDNNTKIDEIFAFDLGCILQLYGMARAANSEKVPDI